MDRYVGLDAHPASCTLAVMGPPGKRLKSTVVETNGGRWWRRCGAFPAVFTCALKRLRSAWLHELLSPHVEELVVAVAPESKGAKDDLRDAWARADELRTGAIRTRVYKAPQHLAALRNAVRGHGFAVRDAVRAMNRLRSVFLSRGISADGSIYNPERRPRWLEKLTPPRRLAECLGRQLDQLMPLREQAEACLLEEAKRRPIIRKLATAPGMGPIRTAQVVAITADPYRFRTRRQYWSYCGFGIVTRSSSDWVRSKDGRWERSQVQQTRGLTGKRHPIRSGYRRRDEEGQAPRRCVAKLHAAGWGRSLLRTGSSSARTGSS